MINSQNIYLRLIKNELENTIIPATNTDNAKQKGTLASSILTRSIIDANVLPKARDEAVKSYQSLLPELKKHLDEEQYSTLNETLSRITPENYSNNQISRLMSAFPGKCKMQRR